MTNTLLSRPDALVDHWRASADGDNPAGPLFSHEYAEADLTTSPIAYTTQGCSLCTATRNIQCC